MPQRPVLDAGHHVLHEAAQAVAGFLRGLAALQEGRTALHSVSGRGDQLRQQSRVTDCNRLLVSLERRF